MTLPNNLTLILNGKTPLANQANGVNQNKTLLQI